ncbi:uncharacterized protein BDZ99DRAFT_127693 [Mytilinidion resinicola]|uniref:Uncharacterized protein n=1 Tax=Mytilinidion resinicola TaxID=574789 RepID=A0A6A6Z731_9PEZI|nr:uncharacterized protein BDZ99DRAFT_127693 [Mytilinidion resinicola]KAF2816055.1 hypothetical protein BDZ99DRAFT_127693 [Mytilinidion resinicola]
MSNLKDLELNDPFWHGGNEDAEPSAPFGASFWGTNRSTTSFNGTLRGGFVTQDQYMQLVAEIVELKRIVLLQTDRIAALELRVDGMDETVRMPSAPHPHRPSPYAHQPQPQSAAPVVTPSAPVSGETLGGIVPAPRSGTRADTPRLRHAPMPVPPGGPNKQAYRPMLADYFGDIEKWVQQYATVPLSNLNPMEALCKATTQLVTLVRDDTAAQQVLLDPTLEQFAILSVVNHYICSAAMKCDLIDPFSAELKTYNSVLRQHWNAAPEYATCQEILRTRAALYWEMQEDPQYHHWRAGFVDGMTSDLMSILAPAMRQKSMEEARSKLTQFFIRAVRISIRMRMDQMDWAFNFPQQEDPLTPSMVFRNPDVSPHEVRANAQRYQVLFCITPRIQCDKYPANGPVGSEIVHGAEVIVKKIATSIWERQAAQTWQPQLAGYRVARRQEQGRD